MNENVIVKEYKINKPLIQTIVSVIGACIRDCHHNYFHTFDHICEYGIRLTNITNNELVKLTISNKSMNFYEVIKKLTVARGNGFIFNQRSNFKKTYNNLTNINIHFYLKLRIPFMHRHFFRNSLKILNIFKHIVLLEIIFFIWHFVNGFYIIFPQC